MHAWAMPDAHQKEYVPESELVLAATKMLGPQESHTVSFRAPAESGDYPYVCTYPGHAMTMRVGERVRWYLLGMGTEVDLHTPHWHGQTLLWMGMRVDVLELLPGSMRVADMRPDNPGTWLYHCHVNDHITAGMLARFRVVQ